jgi:release factor glutamine methyltransferase
LKKLQERLQQLYGEREANTILRILQEDGPGLLGLKPDEFEGSPGFREMARRLEAGDPLQYVLGQADFFGMKFKVGPAVLIPRQETEELVYIVWEEHKKETPQRILDVGTGSGCIAISLKKKMPEAEIWAVDVSSEALTMARLNALKHEADILFREMDFLDPLQWEAFPVFDVIVSNPPYIPSNQKDKVGTNVLRNEPETALFVPDTDALLFYKTIVKFALVSLRPGGKLYLEINEFLGEKTKELFLKNGFGKVRILQDISAKDRILAAERPGGAHNS